MHEKNQPAPNSARNSGLRSARKTAQRAGWRRSDWWWEQWQHDFASRVQAKETSLLKDTMIFGLVLVAFKRDDPRRMGTEITRCIQQFDGNRSGASLDKLTRLRLRWQHLMVSADSITFTPRARSSLFHLRMEARHWDTYQENQRARLCRFISDTTECLDALIENRERPHRLLSRWNGERPATYDEARKFLAACLLIPEW